MINFLETIKFLLENFKDIFVSFLFFIANLSGFFELNTFDKIAGTIVCTFFLFLFIVFILIFIKGGIFWINSYEDNEKVIKAKKILLASLIGIIVNFLLYMASYWMFHHLV